ncbi:MULTISPECIES: acetyl-CoA carboxylase biotin carboxyl carrier protein subunit [Rufibacter]|uniref:Biotin carboxyl carrier protein n=1 Tax=Rufibacter quisquiliarum TaxID=1549639 RepID=A0A839GLW1_9BACT|nr:MULTISPECIES: acetyl-CoA carboxylase biotin carboxyl carrier protein subunit [Rufibacter]MBA9078823.1 biotin carboxyl carrier protein [Rufibacter quisquiliarum]
MLQVKSATKTWQVVVEKNQILLNNAPFTWDLLPLNATSFHIIKDGKSYTAELLETEPDTKTFQIKINGNVHTLQVQDRMDLLLESLGMGQALSQKLNDIKAPMPGLILDIKVTPGQEVKKGDPVLILEAMKMENIIKSPGDGVVSEVKVSVKQNVEKNQVLVVF